MSECMLVLMADARAEPELVDWLLSWHDGLVFSAHSVDCYGMDPRTMTLAEQVTGSQRQRVFQVHTAPERARTLCAELHEAFPGASLRYWILPVIESGALGPAR